MSPIAFLFPGQGSQMVGMGSHLLSEASDLFNQAEDILGWSLVKLCREGPEEKLRQTEFAQPALYVVGYATFSVLKKHGIVPEDPTYAVAGHSIGEYAALAASGVFDFAEGLKLVKERARLMQKAATEHPGTMAAVIGLERKQVEDLCALIQTEKNAGICKPVNFNSNDQIVIAGEKKGVDAFITQGASPAPRIIPLNVSGAFHSPLMKEAAEAMRKAIDAVEFCKPYVPICMNVNGQLHRDPPDVKNCLLRQLDSPVEWMKGIESLKAKFEIFIECGPGRVLSGLLRRIDRQLKTYSTESAEAIKGIMDAFPIARRGIL